MLYLASLKRYKQMLSGWWQSSRLSPDIKGSVVFHGAGTEASYISSCQGSFTGSGRKSSYRLANTIAFAESFGAFDLDAMASNALYGKSQTNQMASLRLLAIIKS